MARETNILKILAFRESRKVGIGAWLFITSHLFLWVKLITASDWMNCILLVCALVGGGTIADSYLKSKAISEPKP